MLARLQPNKISIPQHVAWSPQPGPQTWMIQCSVFEVLYGGARGGGKSDAILGDFAIHAGKFGHDAIGLCVRRERTQLVELIERSKQIYGLIGAKFNEQHKMWRFPNGARLTFAYLENDSDADVYQGRNLSRLYIEEMGNFPKFEPIQKLIACLRSPNPNVDIGMRATANPGGPGHLWIKQRYIDPAPKGLKIISEEFVNPFTNKKAYLDRMYIPSRVTDNKYCNNDAYIARLQSSAGKRLFHAWLHGDWSIIEGAFFEEWDMETHVIPPFIIPDHWTRFVSADWGSAHPFSIGWWAVVPDAFDTDSPLQITSGQQQDFAQKFRYKNNLPRGAIVRYREWYGSPNHNNTGLKLHAEEVAAGIVEREKFEPRNDMGSARISYRVIDPDACKDKGGPSIAERMGTSHRIYWRAADNQRTGRRGAMGGWDSVRGRLKGSENYNPATGKVEAVPMMYFFENCLDSIRTLPVAQHDPDNLEDIQECEDHAIDDIRYACMSRPFVSQSFSSKGPDRFFSVGAGNQVTINDVMEEFGRQHNETGRSNRIR